MQICALPAPAPNVIEIPVRPLANVGGGPINLRIVFASATGAPLHSTAVSLYPADRAQTFAVRIPADGRRLILTLIPGSSPLQIDVGPVRWRDLPR